MKRGKSLLVAAIASGLVLACDDVPTKPEVDPPPLLSATGTEDVTSPALTAFSFTPTTINTTEGSATVTVNFTVTDDLSGAVSLSLSFCHYSAGVGQCRYGSAYFTASTNHTGSLSVTFPQFSAAGTWTLWTLYLADAVGNQRAYYSPELVAGLGFPTQLEVLSVQDVTPPSLTAFSFTPTTINTTDGPATVTVNFTVTDDLSGAVSLSLSFCHYTPGVGQCQYGSAYFTASTSHTGSLSVTFPQFSALGTWTLWTLYLADAVGNQRAYYSPELVATLGIPTRLEMANTLPGWNVQVTATEADGTPSEVTLTFEFVESAGQTLVTTSEAGPPPLTGFRLGNPPVYYDLTTTAIYSGPITVCVDCTAVQYGNELKLRLFHREADPTTGAELWVDRTVSLDPVSNVVCASVSSLSLFVVVELTVIEVAIDIKPGSDPNTINLGSGGTVPVAIFSTADFDARAVDPMTVTLAGAAVKLRGKGTAMAAAEDVNGDGLLDLVVHVETSALELSAGETQAVLEGQTFDGIRIRGSDSVRIVP